MQFTVRDALNIDLLNEAKVRTAQNALHLKPVEWVSVIEIPVENFVRKNELVLTTAVGCGHDRQLLQNFVEEVMESEASALAIATGRHVREIPSDVLQLAESAQFPIIEVPWEVRFADVMKCILDQLNQCHFSWVHQLAEVQQQLLQLFINGASLADVAETLYEQFRYPVLILNATGN